ncbi:MAG: thioredoxin domain-containing protein [Acidobacteriia bacterium]|nr:thioredoxin domain-containing protein [Terriglobia bacterium]
MSEFTIKDNCMRVLLRNVVSCLALASACYAQAAPQSSPRDPIAIIAGQPIYERDLAPEIGSKLLQLHNQEYQIKNTALQDVIRQKLLEAEAKERGVSTEELLKQEVDSKVSEPSDAEVEGYYLAIKNQIDQPLEQIKPQLVKALRALKTQQARQEYEDSLRSESEVVVLLRPPKVEVSYDPARVRGDRSAPVTIVEFADFQCPYCKKADATLNDLLAKYKGQVKLAYRDFPMRTLHTQAQIAAEAARCAEEQGKFWEYHDALFAADQPKLDETGLSETARRLGLEENAFRSCLAGGKFKTSIEQDVQDGTKAGVVGTPAFFLNGVFVNGAQPEAEFEKIINSQLVSTGNRRGSPGSSVR